MRVVQIILALMISAVVQTGRASYCLEKLRSHKPFAYPPIVAELQPGEPHTIADLPAFLTDKLSTRFLHLASRQKLKIQIALGPANRNAVTNALPAGAKVLELPNPTGAFNVSEIVMASGERRVLITNVNGQSRYVQVLSLLRLAGVDERQIFVSGSLVSYKDLYLRTFQKAGPPPDLVVFGFANSSLQGLLTQSRSPLSARVSKANQDYSREKWIKPKFNEHELSKLGVQVLEFEKSKRVWFIDNEYGDRAADIAQALFEHGAKKILFLGTAASLSSKYKIGDIVSPRYFISPDGDLRESPFAAPHVSGKNGIHTHVDSLGLESLAWLNRQRALKVDFAEVELQKVMGVPGSEAIEAYLIISDELRPAGSHDYTHWREEQRRSAEKSILPLVMKQLERIGAEADALKSYKLVAFQ